MKGKIITLILCLIALTTIVQNNYVFQYKLRDGTNIKNFEKRHIPALARICNPCRGKPNYFAHNILVVPSLLVLESSEQHIYELINFDS